MAIKRLDPARIFQSGELEKISGKLPGKWTWPTQAMIWLMDNGFAIELIENFDYRAFANGGGRYLIERFGEEVGRAQISNSDIAREQILAGSFADRARVKMETPDISDIAEAIRAKRVPIVNLNAAALFGEDGYAGHFVVICSVTEEDVKLHDPGLPPKPNCSVAIDDFMRAWSYPAEMDRNLLTIFKK